MEAEIILGAVALAPFYSLAVYAVGKVMLEGFQTADTQAITEKVNPSIVPK